jgi:hypothetical protein
MSFVFDPNENINKAEDDNEPQDVESYVSGEGLFGRVPGGPQVGAADRSQGQPLGDQGLPIDRQGQAQAHGGLEQAQGDQVSRNAGQAPGLLGMLGGVPSQLSLAASAASASVIPTSGYFGSQKCQAFEINARRVICPKHARGAHGSRDYARHQEAATKAIPYPFASAKHFHAKNAEGEASNMYANLQSKYAGNLAKFKTLKRRMDAWDMISPFVIPDFVDSYALSVEDRWGDRKLTGVNLLKNWGKATLKQCRNWQRDSFDYACTKDLTSMEWAKSLMMNSCVVLLVDRIDKKFDELDLYEQGGVTYISRLHLMKCSPSVTLLLQPSRDSLKLLQKKALPRSQMRMSVLLRSRSLPSLKDWPKYLRSQVKVPVTFLKGSLGALLSFSGRLLHICW